tara:strand:- start:5448 stop:7121 length:1674 start_codon:yes stop_codon:yes gene_type:complete
MSANVEITDTFDQWRTKSNEWLSMIFPVGSDNFIKLNNTTNSTSNTTGSIITAGGIGVAASAVIGGKLTVFGDTDIDGNANLDAVDIDGAVQIDAAVTVGVDGTGQDVKFFGDTSGQFLLWDQSADELVLAGDSKLSFHDAAGGENIIASSDGHLEINAGATLDITAPTVDINVATKLNVDGASQFNNTITVGVNDTGHDVKFFGATAGQYLLWDESADELALVGDSKLSFHDAAGGENIIATSDGHLEVNAGTTLDITAPTVDINVGTTLNVDGASQFNNTITVGENDTGYDVKFFGATSGAYMLWDEDVDDLILAGAANFSIDNTDDSSSTTTGSFHTDGGVGIAKKLYVGTDLDVDGTANLDAVDVDDAVQIDGTVTVGVDDTGLDVKFFGASAGAFMLYDQSEDTLEIRGASADATTSTGKLLLTTALTDINDGDVIGRIDFQAPLEAGGTDAIVVGATILAEADATFSSSVNSTDLVFLTGDSGAATEKFRIDSTGQATFADGAIDVNIASHDGTNGLKLGGTLVTATASNLNATRTTATVGKAIAMAMVMG